MFDQETCVLLQGCQRQGLYISNYFPWSLAVIVSVHWFVAISFNIYFSKCAHNTVQILGKHFHIVQDSDSKYGKHVTIVSWQFDSISISDFEYYQNLSVCVSSFFFVRFITSLVWFSWSRTALWWSSASQNTMLSESVDVVMLIMKLGRRPLFCSNVAKARLHTSMSDRQWITCKALMQVLHFFAVLPSLQVCSLFWFLMCRCQCEKKPDHYAIIAYKWHEMGRNTVMTCCNNDIRRNHVISWNFTFLVTCLHGQCFIRVVTTSAMPLWFAFSMALVRSMWLSYSSMCSWPCSMSQWFFS